MSEINGFSGALSLKSTAAHMEQRVNDVVFDFELFNTSILDYSDYY